MGQTDKRIDELLEILIHNNQKHCPQGLNHQIEPIAKLIAGDYLIKNLATDNKHEFNWTEVGLTQLMPNANHVVLVDFHS